MDTRVVWVASFLLLASCAGDCGGGTGGDAGDLDVEFRDVDSGICEGYVDRDQTVCRQRSGCRVGCTECVPADEVADGLDCAGDVWDAGPGDAGETGDTAETGPVDGDGGAALDGDAGEVGADAADAVGDVAGDGDAAAPRWRQCSASSDCVLEKDGCCPWCGTPTLSDLDPVNRNRTTEHENAVCSKQDATTCPRCPQGPIPDSFEAHCSASTCDAIDLSSYQSCQSDSDCRVRTLDCCEDCVADNSRDALVAIAKGDAQQVQNALCPPSPTCANCPIQYPPSVSAVCNSNGRCVLK